jgi:chemotaxis protein histidine kinase CheA
MMFDFNSHLLATEIVISLDDDRTKILELDWDPIILNGDIDKIMVTVRDVTALKELQAAAAEQARELEIIGPLLSIDAAKFNEFISSANDFIDECHALIKTTEAKDADVIATLFRNMHTVKGNARTFGFNYITNSVHNVENTYDELRKVEDKQWNQTELLYQLKLAEVDVQRYQNVARDKLGRDDSQEVTGMASVDKARVDALLTSIEQLDMNDLPESVKGCFKETYQTLVSFDAKPIEEAIQPVLDSAASLSEELNKPTPKMQFNSGGIFIKQSAHSMLNNIFMHVFRNAIDHGIETPDIRAEKGKTEQGVICLDTVKGDGFVEFVIKDDGKGLAISRLYEKALEEGVYVQGERPPAADIANLIFGSGFSTAEKVTEVSGRGVGMDAVKQFLEQEGGSIQVALDDGEESADFRTFATKITLPEQFYITSPEFGVSA